MPVAQTTPFERLQPCLFDRLLDDDGHPNFDVRFYAINKRGEYGSASIWSGGTFTINTGEKESRQLESAFLFRKKA